MLARGLRALLRSASTLGGASHRPLEAPDAGCGRWAVAERPGSRRGDDPPIAGEPRRLHIHQTRSYIALVWAGWPAGGRLHDVRKHSARTPCPAV
jgi:hypothetical protein